MEDYLYGVIGFFVVTGVLTWWSMRKRNEQWESTVTDIEQKSIDEGDEEMAEYHDYHLISYRRSDGKTGHLKIASDEYKRRYPDLRIGDRLVKRSGEYLPVRQMA